MKKVSNITGLILLLALFSFPSAGEEWRIVAPESYAHEEGISAALSDLNEVGHACGLHFSLAPTLDPPSDHAIVLGSPDLNPVTKALGVGFEGVTNLEGYEIVTLNNGSKRILVAAGGSVLGDVYALYWIYDRIRVYAELPDINIKREPALAHRYTRIRVRSESDIRRALRYGLNLVYCDTPLRLVPWKAEPENRENTQFRETTRQLITYAHKLHMKILAFGTDFTYHPSLLDEYGATRNPADPLFWEAVQAKYRMLFKAMPTLDGIATFTADEQEYWGNYKTYDFLHDYASCDWNYEKRYRTFVRKMHEVVVGEYGKIFQCRTWANTPYEQQSQPEIYRRIFTDEVPKKNLYLIPSFTQNDRWWFQAYNPTINQTPHDTMIVCESMDYYAGGNLFPTFPGAYFQAGLMGMLEAEESNLKGISLDMPGSDSWQTRTLTAYTVFRLSWNIHEDIGTIARDFAAIYFGHDAANDMGELLLMSPTAYKYGLFIEPTAYGQFNSLPHIRVGQFIAQGYTSIDGGRAHMAFLNSLYLRCRPWIPETLMYLDHGLDVADTMRSKYRDIKKKVQDRALAEKVGEALDTTCLLIRTNNDYVKTFFAYFQYRERPDEANREKLDVLHTELLSVRNAFAASPGFGYKLFGVDQLLKNVKLALDDLVEAERLLAEARTSVEIEKVIAEEQQKYVEILEKHADEAVKMLHFRGKIDGRDLLRVQGNQHALEHLRWDAPQIEKNEIFRPLPKQAGVIIPKDIQTNALHPFVLEQPSAKNGYTAEIYMNDLPDGSDWWEYDLYYIPHSAEELGLRQSMKAK